MVPSAQAAITFGSGYYTNLCDSGTTASFYNCDPGCNPTTGICQSSNQGVVKWVCTGKWNQCLESESQWTNYEQVDKVSCGYTVQLSVFDKKCRREDGAWDNSCKLLGYMVWYSGDCYSGSNSGGNIAASTPFPSPTAPVSTSKLTKIVATLVPTVKPTAKPTITPTPIPGAKICGLKCSKAIDCKAGFACVSGSCRNPACVSDKSCFCTGEAAATASAITKTTPDTGIEVWLGMGGMLALGWTGIKFRRLASKLW